MPNSTNVSRTYNKTLYKNLIQLFESWGDVKSPEILAKNISHQSELERAIRNKKIHKTLSVTDRVEAVTTYLEALRKARKIWSKMENNDQIELSNCIHDLNTGHAIMNVLEQHQTLTSYKSSEDMAEWRKPVLNNHMSWGMDTEMLDLLIGSAQEWLDNKKPKPYEKINPTLYSVIYICGHCENHNIEIKHSESGRIAKILEQYFNLTDCPRQSKDKSKESAKITFKDLIIKANIIRARDYSDHFTPFEIPSPLNPE